MFISDDRNPNKNYQSRQTIMASKSRTVSVLNTLSLGQKLSVRHLIALIETDKEIHRPKALYSGLGLRKVVSTSGSWSSLLLMSCQMISPCILLDQPAESVMKLIHTSIHK